MTLWVDADSCPRPIRDIVCRAGRRLAVPVVFAANRAVACPKDVTMVILPQEKDAADNYIAKNAVAGDLVVTRDIPLAKRLVDLNLAVINDRGTLYTRENIAERLSIRNFMLELCNSGLKPETAQRFGAKDIKAFADTFDRTLSRLNAAKKPAGLGAIVPPFPLPQKR